jgi:hypothetical protein
VPAWATPAISAAARNTAFIRQFFSLDVTAHRRRQPGWSNRRRHKSLFASFSSEKEESSFFEEKEAKTFVPGAVSP